MPIVFCIHDLIHLRFKQERSLAKRLYYQLVVRRAARAAFRVITVSEFSKKEICSWASLPADCVQVISNGVGEIFKPVGRRVMQGRPFVLYVGNTKPHKNLDTLLDAFQTLQDRQLWLVIVAEEDENLLQRLSLLSNRERILIHSNLSDEQLAELYRSAAVLVLPSHYEGFGLPVVEAMASGTPVVAANTTSIPEVAGKAAWLVDPNEPREISHAIVALLSDQGLYQRMVCDGLTQAAKFSWSKSCELIAEVLSEAAMSGTKSYPATSRT
jgi:glycosyltransferase involved in cell wall biosynthesis